MIKDTDYIIDMLTEKAKDNEYYKRVYLEKIEQYNELISEVGKLIKLMNMDHQLYIQNNLNDTVELTKKIREKYLAKSEDTKCPF